MVRHKLKMATTRILLIALLLSAAPLSGCGSVILTFAKQPEDGNLIYVGTRGRFKRLTFQEDTDNFGRVALLLAWPIIAIDLPLCIAADTLFLPYTIPATIQAGSSFQVEP